MKRLIIIMSVMLLLLNGCGSSATYNLSSNSGGTMAETDDYYYWNNNGLLCYSEKDDLSQWIPVCSKEDCEHVNTDGAPNRRCDANIMMYSLFEIKDNQIFLYSHNRIARKDLDGSNYEVLREWQIPSSHVYTNVAYHEGKVIYMTYYELEGQDGTADEDLLWNSYIAVLDPESTERDIVVFEEQSQGTLGIEFRRIARENVQELFFAKRIGAYVEDPETGIPNNTLLGYVQFDPKTNTLKEVDETCANRLGMIDGKEYFFISGEGMYKEDELIIPLTSTEVDAGIVQDYLYVAEWYMNNDSNKLVFYNKNGKELAALPEEYNGSEVMYSLAGFSEDVIFWRALDATSAPESYIRSYYAMDTKTLAKGKIEMTLCNMEAVSG